MDEKLKTKLEKIVNRFTESDFQEAISLIEEKKKSFHQKQSELREKEAATLLLENVSYLLENKNNLEPEFIKKLEALQAQVKPVTGKKRGPKKKINIENAPDSEKK